MSHHCSCGGFVGWVGGDSPDCGEGWSKSWKRVEVSVVHCTKLETGLNNLEATPFWQTKKSLDG